jgi:hypothetical protein
MLKEELVGTWRLVSLITQRSDGSQRNGMGANPSGLIMYDVLGNFSAQIMRGNIPPFANDDMGSGTPEEIRSAFLGYVAYWGRYEIDEDLRQVRHFPEGSLFPNWLGPTQTRHVELSGTRLVLSTPPILFAGHENRNIITWERAG